ncbi:uncharacterized protein LOC120340903 [Styela clava]
MSGKSMLKGLPSQNPNNFSNFKSDSSKTAKKLTSYLSTEDQPVEQVIVSDRSNILLRYLYLQLDKKLNGDVEKRKSSSEEMNHVDTDSNKNPDVLSSDGPPRKQPRMSAPQSPSSSVSTSSYP